MMVIEQFNNRVVLFLEKTLMSRKFWAAVAASIPFALAGDWPNFAYVWVGYFTVQGIVDAAEKFKRA